MVASSPDRPAPMRPTGALAPATHLLPASQEEIFAQIDVLREPGKGLRPDERRAEVRHLSLLYVGKPVEEIVGADEAED